MEIKQKEVSMSNKQLMILCAMASNVRFTSEIGYQIPQEVWEDSWARILASWICDYVRHYDAPPLEILPAMAKEKMDTVPDEDTAESVVRFSRRIVRYHEEHSSLFKNTTFIMDTALKWIKVRNLTVLQETLEDAIDSGNVKRAEDALHAYIEVKRVESTSIDMMRDAMKIVRAFLEDNDVLFTYPGALGKYTGPFHRGDLMLVMGESGTGKSWMCLQLGMEGTNEGYNCLYVNLENSESSMIRREYKALSGRPVEDTVVDMPYFKKGDPCDDGEEDDEEDDEDEASKKEVPCKWSVAVRKKKCKGLSLEVSDVEKFLRNKRMSTNGGGFRLISRAPNTMTIRDLERELDDLRDYENFIPDILIVDYGDLIKAENRRDEKRARVDEAYLGLRKIALDRNILVISPTQANREGYGKDLKKQNMSENIGNVNHTAILWGLSHSPREKEAGITRVRVLKNRDGKEYADPIICIGNLDIGRIVIDSRRMRDVVNMEK